MGKTARTARTISGGISGIACGFKDIAGLLLCVCSYKRPFIVSEKEGELDFATNTKVGETQKVCMSKEKDMGESTEAYSARMQHVKEYFGQDTINGVAVRRVDVHEWSMVPRPYMLVTLMAWKDNEHDEIETHEERCPAGFDLPPPPRKMAIQQSMTLS